MSLSVVSEVTSQPPVILLAGVIWEFRMQRPQQLALHFQARLFCTVLQGHIEDSKQVGKFRKSSKAYMKFIFLHQSDAKCGN